MSQFTQKAEVFFDSCPGQIARHLRRIFETALSTVGVSEIRSILLIGSAARGEISFIDSDGKLDLLSDYEYIIVTNKRLSAEVVDQLKNNNNDLQEEFAIKSPLFSIDFGIAHHRKWRLTPPTLWAFEVKNASIVIFGEDARNNLQEITISNLDFGNLNQLALVRLWNMLVHIPQNCILGTATEYERFTAQFYYARNILDILTIYLPNAGLLKAGYQNRLDAFDGLEGNIFDEHEISIIKKAHALKLNQSDDLCYEEAQSVFFSGFVKLLAYLAKTTMWNMTVDGLEAFVLSLRDSKIFNDGFIKKGIRHKQELKMFFKYHVTSKPFNGMKWLINEKRYDLLGLMLSLHALTLPEYSSKEKNKFTDLALAYHSKLTLLLHQNINMNPSENFLTIREELLNFMMDWFYGRRSVSKNEILGSMRYQENEC